MYESLQNKITSAKYSYKNCHTNETEPQTQVKSCLNESHLVGNFENTASLLTTFTLLVKLKYSLLMFTKSE